MYRPIHSTPTRYSGIYSTTTRKVKGAPPPPPPDRMANGEYILTPPALPAPDCNPIDWGCVCCLGYIIGIPIAFGASFKAMASIEASLENTIIGSFFFAIVWPASALGYAGYWLASLFV